MSNRIEIQQAGTTYFFEERENFSDDNETCYECYMSRDGVTGNYGFYDVLKSEIESEGEEQAIYNAWRRQEERNAEDED